MLNFRNAEGVHGKKKVGNPWDRAYSKARNTDALPTHFMI